MEQLFFGVSLRTATEKPKTTTMASSNAKRAAVTSSGRMIAPRLCYDPTTGCGVPVGGDPSGSGSTPATNLAKERAAQLRQERAAKQRQDRATQRAEESRQHEADLKVQEALSNAMNAWFLHRLTFPEEFVPFE